MSNLKEQLKADLKTAMKGKDIFKRNVIRFLMSAIKQVEVDERKELNDTDIQKIIQKSIKQREDSATQFKDAGREDLCEKELSEAKVLKAYMPKQLSDDKLNEIVKNIIKESGALSMKDMGKVMQQATSKTAGQADGKRISAVVKKLLS